MNEREIGSAEIFRRIGARASKVYLFGPAIILHIRFLGYASEPFDIKCNISIDQYNEDRDTGIISNNTNFSEYACNCAYEYLESCTEFKGRVLYKDLYEVIKKCLEPFKKIERHEVSES